MDTPYLTLAEIEAKYPNEWVLIDRPKLDRHDRLLGGFVVIHTIDRDELDRKIVELPRPYKIATHYTGSYDDEELIYCLGPSTLSRAND